MRTYTTVPIKYNKLWRMIADKACDKFAMSEEELESRKKVFEDMIKDKPSAQQSYLRMQERNDLNRMWSVTKFFEKVGLSRQTLYSMKKGYGISLSTIDKICTFFKCQPYEIMELCNKESE